MKVSKQLLTSIVLGVSLGLSASQPLLAEMTVPVVAQQIPSLAPMLEKVLPAVVSVYVEGNQVRQQLTLPDEFKFFFGDVFPQERNSMVPYQGLGSGVIIDAEKGYVVTNNHVVNQADKIKIQLNDGHEFTAKLLGRDSQSDIALLQIESPKNLAEIKLANSDNLRVGDYAVAVGNPFGLGQTATSGIISALGRSGLNVNGLENFIQTDASINRGNSGGALLNLSGELIGINTAIIAPNGGNIGIGFAIPSNMVKDLASQLIQFGEVKRGLLGIKGHELTADFAKAFKLDVQKGAFVAEVIPESAAAKAGIKAGDVITSVDDKPIASFSELRAKIATMGAGKKVALGIIRDGKIITLPTELQNSDESNTSAKSITTQLDGATLNNGQINNRSAVKIEQIDENSLAARIGLQVGDYIVGVNTTEVNNIADLRKVIDSKPAIVALNIIRGNSNIYIILR